MEVLNVDCVDMSKLEFGKVSAMAGNAAFVCVKKLIELALEDKVDGTITGPLNKESMNMAGHHYSGHTEIYAEACKTKDYCMFLAHGNLRVSHVSTHVSLREACDRVKKQRVLRVIELTNEACKAFGIAEPKIGVAGLNPHSGENGMFGDEEIKEITPAIEAARAEGIIADGPVPPDTLYSKANGGLYDAAIAMYHDQGHIPLKVVGFVWNDELKRWNSVAGVNITLGLPIVRSSVDHGTAFGKAGKGTATHESLLHAIEYGVKLSNYRKKQKGKA
jgi:4-hydroxythreonine-4-phosphate dehydrogenase